MELFTEFMKFYGQRTNQDGASSSEVVNTSTSTVDSDKCCDSLEGSSAQTDNILAEEYLSNDMKSEPRKKFRVSVSLLVIKKPCKFPQENRFFFSIKVPIFNTVTMTQSDAKEASIIIFIICILPFSRELLLHLFLCISFCLQV